MMHSITQFLSEVLAGGQGDLTLWQAFLAVMIAYLGGVISSLTPCIYPMIPITVSVIGGIKHSKKRAWHEITTRGAAYVGGMTLIYSFLGVLAGISGKVFGTLTNNSIWYLILGAIMTIAALMMLEIIQFDPNAIWNSVKGKVTRSHARSNSSTTHSHPHLHHEEINLAGAFFLGASSGFIAAPCTTPVLTSILAYIAKTQSILLGFSLMLAFSLGLGTLLLVVALFAGVVQILPRSGQWMKTVKIGSGLILLAFAEYLIYRAGSFGGP